MAGPLLKVTGLDVFYGDAQVLWDVGFEVAEGEVFSIIGSNGAGKSTILRAIAGGFSNFASGRVEFSGVKVEGATPMEMVDRGVSLVPEGRGLFSTLTVLENLELGAFTKRARPLTRQTFEEMARLFPILKTRSAQLAGKMSGGEQQMIAIARALMSRPKLLMLDEPSLGLAPIIVQEVFETVKRLKEQGVTILLVEQNIHQALSIADHACVIKAGRVTMTGTGNEVLTDPEVHKAYMGSVK